MLVSKIAKTRHIMKNIWFLFSLLAGFYIVSGNLKKMFPQMLLLLLGLGGAKQQQLKSNTLSVPKECSQKNNLTEKRPNMGT